MRIRFLVLRLLPCAAALSLAAGAGGQDALRVDPGAQDSSPVRHAVAAVQPLGGSGVHGAVTFTVDEAREGEGLWVQTTLEGLPPGPHAYHVHLLGDCTAPDGSSAGTHFNFQGPSKSPPPDIDRITGDLGQVEPDATGAATHRVFVENASLQGPYSIVGRSVVVHERGNDPTQPPIGAAGGRIGCGVIGIAEAPPQRTAGE